SGAPDCRPWPRVALAARQHRKIPPDRASPPPSADLIDRITNPPKLRGFWRLPYCYEPGWAAGTKGTSSRLLGLPALYQVVQALRRNDDNYSDKSDMLRSLAWLHPRLPRIPYKNNAPRLLGLS